MHKKFNKGFSLAEMLLTVAVIGVIAALTIPSVVYDVNKDKFAAGFLKINRELDSATRKIIDDAGEETLTGVFADNTALLNTYSSIMSTLKTCSTAQGNCWHSAGVEKALGGGASGIGTTVAPGLILSDGTYLLTMLDSPSCSGTTFKINSVNAQCAKIYADVNGASGPNRVGRDIFMFEVASDGLHLGGAQGDDWYSATNVYCDAANTTSNNGYGCPFRILIKGEMDY